MKKILILTLIALLLVLAGFLGIRGLQIGNIQILGITGIMEKNDELDAKIEEATKLASTDFEKSITDVETSGKELKAKKQEYEELISGINEEDVALLTRMEGYEIETLLVKLGNHAKQQGAEITMTAQKAGMNLYNLKFSATGSYISITDFISAVENDSLLGFKIEEFSMKPQGETLEATFVCKGITIEGVSEVQKEEITEDAENTEEKEETKNTNTTNSTKTTLNTTKNANSTNTTKNTNEAE